MPRNNKILITGSLGYLGSVLTPYLVRHGYECVGYDAGFFRDCVLYPPQDAPYVLRDARALDRDALRGVDVVVHLAGISNDPFGNLRPETIYDPTRKYALDIATLCKAMGIKFIFASSCSIYGIGGRASLDEDAPTHPQTPYSLNKLQVEQDLAAISDKNFSPICLRFATAFGVSPRMRFDIVINMLVGMACTSKKIILNSDGQSWRPNVHIQDILKSIQYAIDHSHDGGKPLIVNVGDDANNFQIRTIAEMVRDAIPGCSIDYLHHMKRAGEDAVAVIHDKKIQDGVDQRTYRVVFHRIKKVFKGFACDWPLHRGIEDMISKFHDLRLTPSLFKNPKFYRLQKIEQLFHEGFLTPDLLWIDQAGKGSTSSGVH